MPSSYHFYSSGAEILLTAVCSNFKARPSAAAAAAAAAAARHSRDQSRLMI
jgi:hypothetical protein